MSSPEFRNIGTAYMTSKSNNTSNEQVNSILNDIVIEFLGHARLPERKSFRAKRAALLGMIEQLEQTRILETDKGLYHIPLFYFRSSQHWALEGRNANQLFKMLKDRYVSEQDKPQSVPELIGSSHLRQDEIQRAIYYLIRANITGGHNGDDLNYTSVTPFESMLKYETVEQIIDEREGWRVQNASGNANRHELPLAFQKKSVRFDCSHLHPRIIQASSQHFANGNFREAIFNAYVSVFDFIRERTGVDADGLPLAESVFSVSNPTLALNKLISETDKNEQIGFILLLQGAFKGIRNPKAHTLNHQAISDQKAFEYLAFASLLTRRIEESKVIKKKPKGGS